MMPTARRKRWRPTLRFGSRPTATASSRFRRADLRCHSVASKRRPTSGSSSRGQSAIAASSSTRTTSRREPHIASPTAPARARGSPPSSRRPDASPWRRSAKPSGCSSSRPPSRCAFVPKRRPFDVPQEIVIARPADRGAGLSGWATCGGGGIPRPWWWIREKNGALVGQLSGTLRWPEPCDDAEDHGAELLGVAEAGFEIGCTPASAPANVTWSAPGIVPGGGNSPRLDDPDLAPLRRAFAVVAGAKRRVCANK